MTSRSVRPEDRSTLTPLGPGGRPFARWRGPVALAALCGLVAVTALLLSDRAPGAIDSVSERVAVRIDREAPDARNRAVDTLERSGIEERDTLAHIGLWSVTTLLVGLATWSWRSLAGAVLVVAVGSTALELVQEALAPSRITEWRDVAANAAGIGLGTAVVVATNSVSGLPARIRRWRRSASPGTDHRGRPD